MVFESFDIEAHPSCSYDWVEVSYGSYSEKFCGSTIPEPFTSTGQTMTVRFQTDGSVVGLGFSAVWREVVSQGGVPANQQCNPQVNHWDCCSSTNRCDEGEGDCDSDEDCIGNLVCGSNNCNGPWYMWYWMDCCRTLDQGIKGLKTIYI